LMENIVVRNNHSDYGGGIGIINSNPVMINITIEDNYAWSGGGIYISHSSPTIINTVISGNSASTGAGMKLYSSSPSLSNVTVRDNIALWGGGGITSENSTITFDTNSRCNIYSNTAYNGSEIYSDNPINLILDTFTVEIPTHFHLFPLSNFDCHINQGKYEQILGDVYVSPNGSDNNSGTLESSPFKTIFHAMRVFFPDSTIRSTIHLAQGTYSPSQNGEFFPVTLLDYAILEAKPDGKAVLDAEGTYYVLWAENLHSSEINGLILTNGLSVYGGGINSENSNLKINNTIITNNEAEVYGGGIYSILSNLMVTNSIISNNKCTDSSDPGGGGIYSDRSSMNFINTLIVNNTCTNIVLQGDAGAILSFKSTINFTNGVIGYNYSDDLNCIILFEESSMAMANSILWNNFQGGIGMGESSNFIARYSDIQGGWEGIGNIQDDPQFIMSVEDPYELSEGSPCIDRGNPDTSMLNLPAWDLFGNYRIWDGNGDGVDIIDMGAYEYGSVGVGITKPNHDTFYPKIICYPNPAIESMIMEYELPYDSWLKISILNGLGQKICIVVNEFQRKGFHQVRWNTVGLSSGIYFYQLSASGGEKVFSGKLLIKK
jgi:hypothetical protein